jgi:hypothetical protein
MEANAAFELVCQEEMSGVIPCFVQPLDVSKVASL